MSAPDPLRRIQYRRALSTKVEELLGIVLPDSHSNHSGQPLYDEHMLLAFADAGASLREDINIVLAYFVSAESNRLVKRYGLWQRLVSPESRRFHNAHLKLKDAGLKLMAGYAKGPAMVERYQLFLQAAFSFQMENGMREIEMQRPK